MRRANPRVEDVLKNLPTLETDRLIQRKMTPNDAEAIFAYASDPEVTLYVSWETHRKIGDSESFLRSVVEGYEKGEAAEWGIAYKGDGRFVGGCGVVGWDLDHARAELGYVLSREYWGRGLMSEAVRAIISFGFKGMDLNRIEARCIMQNTASARVMEKAGMLYEGTLRQREFIKGAYRDMKLYAILRSEYLRSARSPRRPG
jgi:ribosomal-protein-alanine N-acetyltransferase